MPSYDTSSLMRMSLSEMLDGALHAVGSDNEDVDSAASNEKEATLELSDAAAAGRLQQRQKQIRIGKATQGYQRYTQLVPRGKRGEEDLDTPPTSPSTLHLSKRTWDKQLRTWRKFLHQYDKPDTTSKKSRDSSSASTSKQNTGSRSTAEADSEQTRGSSGAQPMAVSIHGPGQGVVYRTMQYVPAHYAPVSAEPQMFFVNNGGGYQQMQMQMPSQPQVPMQVPMQVQMQMQMPSQMGQQYQMLVPCKMQEQQMQAMGPMGSAPGVPQPSHAPAPVQASPHPVHMYQQQRPQYVMVPMMQGGGPPGFATQMCSQPMQ